MKSLLLLRPEPGLSASLAAARSAGLEATGVALFEIVPVRWDCPDPAAFDALLMTSANAPRLAGPGLGKLAALPVHAVGEATARAAQTRGLTVASIGSGGVDTLIASIDPNTRLLHLAGADSIAPTEPGPAVERVTVYRAQPVGGAALPTLGNQVIAVHSSRAGARLDELADVRGGATIAAISRAAADACGPGWERVEIAETPSDSALLALAARLCQASPR